ncbi:hypothetical protein Hypma_013963 [Hypsizygus marmoreus]|uniref:F-box domain-containing protein n=1 Tax=Hypsizygus marmoreus TaxID=39966 RepID=A0A369K9F3_HYPMA|nr:hypothetical protein Hypma_013963 [Hypsizygus marmoreus]
MQILLQACTDEPAMLSLLLVCRTVHEWTLPVLYHSVTFWNRRQIESFYAAHDPRGKTQDRLMLIKNLWVGDTPLRTGNLQQTHGTWPIANVYRILKLCTNLQSLYIIKLHPNRWNELESAVPASLENLAMGPIHGTFRINSLSSHPRLRRFTSYHSYMRDGEILDMVLYPSMRQFRRVIQGEYLNWYYAGMKQDSCISQSDTMEKMMLVVCGRNIDGTLLEQVTADLRDVTQGDQRVVVQTSECENGIELLFAEFREERAAHLAFLNRVL